MCCYTHTPAYVFKGSLLVQAEEEAFRCRCPCLGCPRRADGEDLRCAVCRDPAAALDPGMSPWGRASSYGAQSFEVPRWYPAEAGEVRFGEYRRLLREAAPPGSWQPFEIEASGPLDWSLPAGLSAEEEALARHRLSPGGQERVARMMREAGGTGLPEGSFPVVNGVARTDRWDQAGIIRLEPQAFAADSFHVEPGSPLA